MDHAVATHELTRTFGDKKAVDELSLRVAGGRFFGFLGPNGAGKTTTIKMLTGLLKITAGRASVLGFDLARQAVEVKRRIGVVPEELALFDRLTGAEYLTFVGRMYGLDQATATTRARELLELMDLRDGKNSSSTGLAASGLAGLHRGEVALSGVAVVGLLLWNGAGLGLGYLVFSTYHFGARERARKKVRAPRRAGAAVRERRPLTIKASPLAFLPDAILAVAGKQLRYLGRSALGKYGIIGLPLVVVIILTAMGGRRLQAVLGLAPESLLLYGILLYAVLLSNNPVHNAFAWERGGMQWYFLSPTPLDRIMAGKNLAVLAVNALVFGLCMAIWTLFVRLPDGRTWVMSVLFFAYALGLFILAGNVVSILFPRAMDVSSLGSTPSQAGTLFAFLSVVAAGGVLMITMAVPALLGLASLQPVGLAVVLVAVVGGYFVVLKLAARLLAERREAVIETVTSKD